MRSRSFWNSVRIGHGSSGSALPLESPEKHAQGERLAFSLASISCRTHPTRYRCGLFEALRLPIAPSSFSSRHGQTVHAAKLQGISKHGNIGPSTRRARILTRRNTCSILRISIRALRSNRVDRQFLELPYNLVTQSLRTCKAVLRPLPL